MNEKDDDVVKRRLSSTELSADQVRNYLISPLLLPSEASDITMTAIVDGEDTSIDGIYCTHLRTYACRVGPSICSFVRSFFMLCRILQRYHIFAGWAQVKSTYNVVHIYLYLS